MDVQRGKGWLCYGVPGVVLGLGLAWFLGGRGSSALAQGAQPPALTAPTTPERTRTQSSTPPAAVDSGSGTMAFTTPGPNGGQILMLIDPRQKAFAVYRIDPSNSKGTVKLEAVRQYQWDLKLDEYNNLPPEVAAIESSVKRLGSAHR